MTAVALPAACQKDHLGIFRVCSFSLVAMAEKEACHKLSNAYSLKEYGLV